MGSQRLTLCTGTLCAGLLAVTGFTTAACATDNGQGVSVTPVSPAPGTDVSLRVRGCSATRAVATSKAFVADARLTSDMGVLSGDTRVRASVAPGVYDVRITCADVALNSRITIGRKGAGLLPEPGDGNGGTGLPDDPPAAPITAASPVAPVAAGGGGTAHFATVATDGSGPGTGQAVTGLALAGIAAAAVGLRRSRRSQGTD
ncbi:hypothetical protein [Streptomyces cellostaticus]|uniref:hypothetical protein n=1 Tax=Streptomyces TaxID=1883 RepID=UPI00202734CD|nr:hypothetical protein [Streptomyces cellostaticus]